MLHLEKSVEEKRLQQSTVLIVAQRISTILHAEQIIVLDEGQDCRNRNAQRTFGISCEVYRQIAASQLSEEELRFERKGGRGKCLDMDIWGRAAPMRKQKTLKGTLKKLASLYECL